MSAFTPPPPPLMTTRNGIKGSFVKAVQAFEQFELDPKVVLLVGLAVDRVQDLLTAFGTAAVDDSEDIGCVFGDRLASWTLHSLEELICVVFGIFEFVAPAAERAFGDADDGGEVAPGGAGFGGLFEGFRVVQEFEGVHAGRSLVWEYKVMAALKARPDG